MYRKTIRRVAELVGFAAMGLLALYGGLVLLQAGGPVQAAQLFQAVQGAQGTEGMQIMAQQDVSARAAAEFVPSYLNYQGTLRDVEGDPLNGHYDMTFRIYDGVGDPVDQAVWSETHVSVTVRSGHFSVLLGNNEPISPTLFSGPDRFVGVTVDPFDEMVPRQRFASVPYAIYAEHSAQALDASHAATADHATALSASDGDPVDAVVVDAEGNVGVGTGSPRDKMEVRGGLIVRNRGGDAVLLNLDTERSWQFRQHGSGAGTKLKLMSVGGGGNKDFVVDTGGSVGIGTTNPGAKLHVNGSLRTNGSARVDGDMRVDGDIRGKLLYTEKYTWVNGDPVQMIHSSEGFCFLTRVLKGGTSTSWAANVYIGDGGFWYVDGNGPVDVDANCAGTN